MNLERLSAQTDSIELAFGTFLRTILTEHPLAQKAQLRLADAEAVRLAAKGLFDPILDGQWKEKYLDDKHYYRNADANITLPTKLGLSLVGRYENNEGDFLNPENSTSSFGLWSVGIEANLLQGLLIDNRRAALRKAAIYQDQAMATRTLMLNEVLLEAIIAYIDWQVVAQNQAVIQERLVVAQTYFEGTKQSFYNGDKPAIDTLEAMLIVQDIQNVLQDNQVTLTETRLLLSNYLWLNEAPVNLSDVAFPEGLFELELGNALSAPDGINLAALPEIREKRLKQQALEVEQQLKRDKLKPKLSLSYHPLLNTAQQSIVPEYDITNYRWGVKFSMPMLFRQERGNIQRGAIKIQETSLEIMNKSNAIKNKLEATFQKYQLLLKQIDIQEQNVANYFRLLNAEREKFAIGESSVFLLNKREESYLKSRIKRNALMGKLQAAKILYRFYANELLDWIQTLQ